MYTVQIIFLARILHSSGIKGVNGATVITVVLLADCFVSTIVDNFPWHENVYLSLDSQKPVAAGIAGTRREGG